MTISKSRIEQYKVMTIYGSFDLLHSSWMVQNIFVLIVFDFSYVEITIPPKNHLLLLKVLQNYRTGPGLTVPFIGLSFRQFIVFTVLAGIKA